MAKKIIEKKGTTPGNRQYTSVVQGGTRKTVVYHPDEGAYMKTTKKGGKPEKGTMGVVNSGRGGSDVKKGPTKPARKVDLPYKGGTVRKRK